MDAQTQSRTAPSEVGPALRAGLLICATLVSLPAAQLAPSRLDQIVVTATRIAETAGDLPYATSAFDTATLTELAPRTLPELLREETSVMIQKTALGQGSPFIRGFTGFRTVLLVDGLRLNNATFREGPNQYWNTVDSWSIAALEVVKGPTSVQYGSDAVGGTVQVHTVRPRFDGDKPVAFAHAASRYASAEGSQVGRLEAGAGLGPHSAFVVGATTKHYGDLRAGGAGGRQPHTGYDELKFDAKFEHRFSPQTRLTLAHQTAEQDDIWRTHATVYAVPWRGTRPGSNLSRFLDQGRRLSYAQLDATQLNGPLRELHAGLAHQRQTEDEFRQRANLRVERGGFTVNTLGAYLHGQGVTRLGRWVVGGDWYRDCVDSYLREYDAAGTLVTTRVQGPVADGATYDLAGLFAENRLRLAPRLDATVGVRLNHTRVAAGRVATPGTGQAFALTSRTSSFAGNFRLLYAVDAAARWRLFAGVAQGVRAPNLSDLTRFDIAEAGQIETPVNQLDPERFVTFEVGARAVAGKLSTELVLYRTAIQNLIVRTPTGAFVAGLAEVTKRNSGRGHIHGIEVESQAALTPLFSLRARFSWMEGRLRSYPTAAPVLVTEPVSRLMPATFVGTARWGDARRWVAATATLAAKADKLAAQDRVDVERIPPGGTPGYAIGGLRAGWQATSRLLLTAAIENLTDTAYRIHGSGLNEPGRNLVFTARFTF